MTQLTNEQVEDGTRCHKLFCGECKNSTYQKTGRYDCVEQFASALKAARAENTELRAAHGLERGKVETLREAALSAKTWLEGTRVWVGIRWAYPLGGRESYEKLDAALSATTPKE